MPHPMNTTGSGPTRATPPEVFAPRKLTLIASIWIGAAAAIVLVIAAAGDRFPDSFQIGAKRKFGDIEVISVNTSAFLVVTSLLIGLLGLMVVFGVLRRQPGTGKGQLVQLLAVILGAVLVPAIVPVIVAAFAAGDYPSQTASEAIYLFSIVLVLPALIFSFLGIRKPKAQPKS